LITSTGGGVRNKGSGQTLSRLKELHPDAKSVWEENTQILQGGFIKDGSVDKHKEDGVMEADDVLCEDIFLVENDVMEANN
jgi:hypothetical protein